MYPVYYILSESGNVRLAPRNFSLPYRILLLFGSF